MGAVFLLAVGLAALKLATYWCADLIMTIVVGVLLFAILGIIYREGHVRRFWTGFAVFGCFFLMVSVPTVYSSNVWPAEGLLLFLHFKIAHVVPVTETSDRISVWIREGRPVWIDGVETADRAEVQQLIEKAVSRKPGIYATIITDSTTNHTPSVQKELVFIQEKVREMGIPFQGSLTAMDPEWDAFSRVGHSLVALLAALIGGTLAYVLLPTKQAARENASTESSSA